VCGLYGGLSIAGMLVFVCDEFVFLLCFCCVLVFDALVVCLLC